VKTDKILTLNLCLETLLYPDKSTRQFLTVENPMMWLKSKTPATPNAGQKVEQQELSQTGRNTNWHSHFGK
jgi:hypothetical protein